VRLVRHPAGLAGAALVVLPGSKTTVADLAWLRATGLDRAIARAAREGRTVVGICGGYQMLGLAIHDPHGVESTSWTTAGLGLLPVETVFAPAKRTDRVRARVAAGSGPLGGAAGRLVAAYEIHAGRTTPLGEIRRPFTIVERGGQAVAEAEGALRAGADGTVLGTYLHGSFEDAGLRRALLEHLAAQASVAPDPRWGAPASDRYDRLADLVAASVDVPAVAKLVGLAFPRA
jgi:adenosylcobyric acid synthase